MVELEHRHRFLIGQRRVRAAEAFELLFIESGQPIIERLVFRMCYIIFLRDFIVRLSKMGSLKAGRESSQMPNPVSIGF